MACTLMGDQTLPVRVLMLSHYFAERRGGIEAVAAALARQLTERGFQVLWLASGDPTSTPEGIDYLLGTLPASSIAERMLGIPYPILRSSAWRKIYRESARHDVILIHDTLYMTSILGYLAARARRKPLVIVQHVAFVPFTRALLRGLMRVANRLITVPLLRSADQVVFISQLTLQHFAHIRWRRAPLLIFNGVDTTAFRPPADSAQVVDERRKLDLPAQAPVALFVGRFVEKKGLRVLEQLARLRADMLFVCAGHGPLDPRGWQLSNVRVYSGLYGAELAALYRASNVLVLPSVGEGFPLVVQEGLACGIAVVCGRDTASADERATPLLDSVAVDPRDPLATAGRFAAELRRLQECAWRQAERRQRAEFARASYSWSASGARYADILQRLCAPLTAPLRR
jgi:starch synthase